MKATDATITAGDALWGGPSTEDRWSKWFRDNWREARIDRSEGPGIKMVWTYINNGGRDEESISGMRQPSVRQAIHQWGEGSMSRMRDPSGVQAIHQCNKGSTSMVGDPRIGVGWGIHQWDQGSLVRTGIHQWDQGSISEKRDPSVGSGIH